VDVAELRVKYVEIVRLRVARREDPNGAPPIVAIRQLARRFPGALRELERLPLAAALARQDELAHVLAGGTEPLWSIAQRGYHDGLRAALAEKRAAFAASERTSGKSDHTPVMRVPLPGGKLTSWVVAEVARGMGIDVSTCRALLFPWEQNASPQAAR
jgi:hypothetical protein